MTLGKRTPQGFRLHIGIFGRRNAGKSSLLNAITRQAVSIVSDVPGTTTDPVEKPMELLPLGPVLFIDTAGIDDEGALGEQRVAKTRRVFDRTDVGIIVAEASSWTSFEEAVLGELKRRGIPAIVALSKADALSTDASIVGRLSAEGVPVVVTAAKSGLGMDDLRDALFATAPEDPNATRIISDLVPKGGLAILVIPIDKEAPKGRIILPQVQTMRDLLDHHAMCVVCTDEELPKALQMLKEPPSLVVTDSQAFEGVAAATPEGVPLTSFSILFARLKGDLAAMAAGAAAVAKLGPNDRVLVAEACTHHPIGEDIGRVKLPAWLRKKAGEGLEFETVQGKDFPEDLSKYALAVHCGACMFNKRAVVTRVRACREADLPISNYGLVIAACLGILERALAPFPEALDAYRRAQKEGGS